MERDGELGAMSIDGRYQALRDVRECEEGCESREESEKERAEEREETSNPRTLPLRGRRGGIEKKSSYLSKGRDSTRCSVTKSGAW